MSVIQKPLKDANFLPIYVFVYNNYVCDMYVTCVYTTSIADVQKPGRVHMGHARLKINNAAVVY